ncbi:MAG: serine acetyltransferase [Solirubrobacteraceae bacterium]
MKHKAWLALYWLRAFLAIPWLIPVSVARNRGDIRADMSAWMRFAEHDMWEWHPHTRPSVIQLLYLLGTQPPFRSLCWYRLERAGVLAFVTALPLRLLYRGEPALRLHSEYIGPGLYLPHAFSTILAWRSSIGHDCRIYQGVTIGWDDKGNAPRLGDRVTVYASASIIGDVTIGDDVIVGAGAVVLHDVPPGVTVAGVPAQPIRSRRSSLVV